MDEEINCGNFVTPHAEGYITKISNDEEKPAFLPQEADKYIGKDTGENVSMGPIGPWATGRVDWRPLAGLTGTRPAVDQYSVTRYSDAEWRKHNEDVLCNSSNDLHRANMAEFNSRRELESIAASTDKNQYATTLRLAERRQDLLRWKSEVEKFIEDMSEEIRLLESQKQRAYAAENVLNLICSISSECLARRTMREGYDLCRDTTEEELIKEASLVQEVKNLIERTINQIEEQLVRNRVMKGRLEDDWSDKQEAYDIECLNIGMKNTTATVLFKPVSIRFSKNQSSQLVWEDNTKDLLATADSVKVQSCELRALLSGPILFDCIRDLKAQADKVDMALARGISEKEQCVTAMHSELETVIRRNADSEKLVLHLQLGIRGFDKAMKVAQTRLDFLQKRPGIENCRDKSQLGLVDEVKSLSEQVGLMKEQLHEAENCLAGLVRARGILEKELQNKLKSLYIDKNRCQIIRSHYPSATLMTGH